MNETDYKVIADRLVVEGTLFHDDAGYFIRDMDGNEHEVSPYEACHDWRVAGACMERDVGFVTDMLRKGTYQANCYCGPAESPTCSEEIESESLPLAIILAYLEATDGN